MRPAAAFEGCGDGGGQPVPSTRTREERVLFALLFALIAGFAFSARPFVNYGYDYVRYLPTGAGIAMALAFLCLGLAMPGTISGAMGRFVSARWVPLSILLTAASAAAFWIFSTEFHMFGGDGAEWTLSPDRLTIFSRLHSTIEHRVHNAMWRITDPGSVDVLPAYFAMRCYSVFWGAATVAAILFACRREPALAAAILTSFWMLNFFGNLDSYAVAVFYAVAFWTVLRELRRNRPEPSIAHAALVVALWCVGMWIHPLQVFLGFFAIEYLHPRVRRMGIALSPETMFVLLGVTAFVLLRLSRFAIPLSAVEVYHASDTSDLRHYDSIFALFPQTLAHYLNNVALPLLPWLAFLALKTRHAAGFRGVLLVVGLVSLCFFSLYFRLGTVDQFSYYHLLCVLSLYLFDACSRSAVESSALLRIAALNLFVLVPMVWVHSGPLTVNRAWRVFPPDRCQHNATVSWQSRLGVNLGNNIQPSRVVEENVLEAFRNGSLHAEEPGQRLGNYTYYVAWHYHFGRIEEGRRLLAPLLRQYPQASGYLLGDRPGFTYFNADILRSDTLSFFPSQSTQLVTRLRSRLGAASRCAAAAPYYTRPSPYEVNPPSHRERRKVP